MAFQGLLDPPRNLTFGSHIGEVSNILSGAGEVEVGYGLEMHWPTQTIQPSDPLSVFDISDILMEGSSVSYDNTAKIGGTANLVLDPNCWSDIGNNSLIQAYAAPGAAIPAASHALYWGNWRTRLRVYQTLTIPGVGTAKFYQGTYIPASPTAPMDSPDAIYSVACYALESIFDIPLTFDVAYPAGTSVLNTVVGIINTIGNNIGGGYVPWTWISYLSNNKTTNVNLAWLADGSTTWLDVINALLATIGYYNLYSDCYGTLQLSPWIDPRFAPIDWTFDLTDATQNIVDPTGTWAPDSYQVPNKWVFILQNSPGTPVEGNGQYTLLNQGTGPSSINRQAGRVQLSYHELNATSQGDLVTQGNAIMIQELANSEIFTISTSPLPLAGHADVVKFVSNNIEPNMFAAAGPSNARRCAVQSWDLPLNGDPMTWTLGTVG